MKFFRGLFIAFAIEATAITAIYAVCSLLHFP